ncbi:MAG TPA: A24 family peptidase [Acidimicrobiales bacterium]|nr:A24 family peptidase [Acidimicrobiales bacterium]
MGPPVVVATALAGAAGGWRGTPLLASLAARYQTDGLVVGLLGRGRGTRAALSATLAGVEATLAAAAAPVDLPALLILGATLVAAAMIDLDRGVIPRRLVWPALAASAVLVAAAAGVAGEWPRLEGAAVGGVTAFAVLGAVHLAVPRALGFGDARLAAIAGLFLGWESVPTLLVALVAAWLLAAAMALPLALRGGRSARLPLGPALAAGTLVGVVWGPTLLRAWTG